MKSYRVMYSGFSNASNTYDDYAIFQQDTARKLVAYIISKQTTAPKHILDLGAGTGYVTSLLKKKYPEAHFTLIDNALPMLEKAQKNLGSSNYDYICHDASDTEFVTHYIKDNDCDLLVSNLCFQWFENPDYILNIYNKIIPCSVTSLLDGSFESWYQSILAYHSDYKIPIQFMAQSKAVEQWSYGQTYDNAHAFLSEQKKLGTLMGNPKIKVTKLRQAMRLFEQVHKSKITYNIGLFR